MRFFFIPSWIKSYLSSHPSSLLIPAVWLSLSFLLKWGRSCLFSIDLLCACVTVLPVLAHPHALPTLLTFASLPIFTIIFVPTCLLHLLILPKHLYSFSDHSQAHSLRIDSLCSQDRTFFPPPPMPFLSPYFRISAPMWFILRVAFIFFHLIPHFPSPPPITGKQNFLVAIKQHDFRCWTLNQGQTSSIQASEAPFCRKSHQQQHKKIYLRIYIINYWRCTIACTAAAAALAGS